MDELIALPDRAEDEADAAAVGTTLVLTEEGWEASQYIDPEDDWTLQTDGSYLSPNGLVRTWPLSGFDPR